MSYLSPLPHYPAPSSHRRSRSYSDLGGEEWQDPRLLLPHPLHPQRFYHLAGGRQRMHNPPLSNIQPSLRPFSHHGPQWTHAATRLRKTEYGESLRGDQPNLPDGRVDGETQRAPRRDWTHRPQQHEMGVHQAREEVPPPPSDSYQTGSLGHVHRHPHPLSSQPSTITSTATFSSSSSSDYSIPSKASSSSRFFNNNVHAPPSSTLSSLPPFSSSARALASSPLPSSRSQSSWVSEIEKTEKEPPPVYALPSREPQTEGLLYSTINKTASSSIRPSPPTNDFARQLRDSGLTERQKAANEARRAVRTVDDLPFDGRQIIQEATRDPDDVINSLVSRMQAGMGGRPLPSAPAPPPPPPPLTSSSTSSSNVCVNCHEEITGAKPGCTALDKIFHVACFTCSKCGDQLAGSSFYNVDGAPICEKDYVATLEKCSKCGEVVTDRLLRAVGGAFHAHCFSCVVCNIALDGIPFTVDGENRVHCVPCFHEQFAPRCAVCAKPIVPEGGEKESVRVVAMDKSFHVQCYRCEDCGLQLSSKIEGQGCYPLDSHLYCKTCNGNRLRLLSAA